MILLKKLIEGLDNVTMGELRQNHKYTWGMGAEFLVCTYLGKGSKPGTFKFKVGNSEHLLSIKDVKDYIYPLEYMDENIIKEDKELKNKDLMQIYRIDNLIHELKFLISNLEEMKTQYYKDFANQEKNLNNQIEALKSGADLSILPWLITELPKFRTNLINGKEHLEDELKSFAKLTSAPRWINVNVMKANGISAEDINGVIRIATAVEIKIGDEGTVVLGSSLNLNGRPIIEPYSQGNVGPEKIYAAVKLFLSNKYPKLRFEIDYGRMD